MLLPQSFWIVAALQTPPQKKPKNARASRGVKGPVKVGKAFEKTSLDLMPMSGHWAANGPSNCQQILPKPKQITSRLKHLVED